VKPHRFEATGTSARAALRPRQRRGKSKLKASPWATSAKSPIALIQLAQPETVWAICAFRGSERSGSPGFRQSDVDEVRLFEANEQTQVIAQLRIACPLPA